MSLTDSYDPRHKQHRKIISWLLYASMFYLIFIFGSHLVKTEREARAQRERVELYLMSDPIAKVACNTDHNIIIANLAAEKLFGYEHGELVGKPISILIPPKNRPAHDKAIDAARYRVQSVKGDWLIRQAVRTQALKRDGTLVETLMDIRTIKYGKPSRVEFVASLVDLNAEEHPQPQSIPLPKLLPQLPSMGPAIVPTPNNPQARKPQ